MLYLCAKDGIAMPFPNLTAEQVQQAVPDAANIVFLAKGGQKVVFSCTINRNPYALKLLQPHLRPLMQEQNGDASPEPVSIDDVTARAQREVATMKECDTPHLVKIGPIEMRTIQIEEEDLLCFSEELIDGFPLSKLLKQGIPLPPTEVIELGQNVATAIGALWHKRKIHRDIKPSNIMRRRDGGFVLLDLGLVFDLNDESYSVGPVGTHMYFSPEQMDFANRRQVLDFRSDLFSLGITMYQMATGSHPFVTNANTSWDVVNNIRNLQPPSPRQVKADIPEGLSDTIMRLLGKRPSLRFRSIDKLQQALSDTTPQGGK
jgi:eukaryotic-like serine/threonine-protein kinase